jgi:ribonucleoside-triphosphate reductase
MVEEETQKPLFQPHLILNLTASDLKEKALEPLLLKAHTLAVKYGTLYFANLTPEWQKGATYLATGVRLAQDWTGDWELDTLRTGNLGTVVVNLPRLVYEAKNNQNNFFNNHGNSPLYDKKFSFL